MSRPLLAAFVFGATALHAQQWEWAIDRALPGDFQGQIAYDAARERMVLFGCVDLGDWAFTPRSFTFEWVGGRWMYRHSEIVQVRNATLCYDPVRRRVVRTCGSYDSLPSSATSEWDGQTWTQRAPPTPTARTWHASTLHAATGHLLLFGGCPQQTLSFLGDTWELSGNTWTLRAPAVAPTMRFGHAMAYDPGRGRSVLFGGTGNGLVTNWLRNDTWEWDGATWNQRQPMTVPPARSWPALAHDPRRGRTVLFGGSDYVGPRADTWEWDGTDWRQVATVHAPSPRQRAALAFEPATGNLMLFGGATDYVRYADTWSYDGNDWRQLLGPAGPTRRVGPALVHDFGRGRTVLFGGSPDDGLTWETDGRTWQCVPASPSPTPRYAQHAAYDAWRGTTVLFGGRSALAMFGDTWEWDGTTWTQRATTPAPSPRSGGSMAFDLMRGVVVLFGGQDIQNVFSETWEWDSIAWRQRTTVHTPQWTSFAMTYDLALGRIVMFGGSDNQGPRADTWHYDGLDWTLMGSAGPAAPPPRYDPALTYHAGRGRTVLFGGGVPLACRNDLWEWDGVQWTPWNVVAGPEPQTGATLAYDYSNQRLVLTGGYYLQHCADTWVLGPAGPATVSAYGTGCASAVPAVLHSDLPFLGNAGCSLEIVGAAAQAPALLLGALGAANVPLPGGCTLLVQTPFVTALAATNALGVARFPLAVPPLTTLRGAGVSFQAVVHDAIGPLAGTSWTGGLRLVAGD